MPPMAPCRRRRFHPLFHLRMTATGAAVRNVPDVRITNGRTAQVTTVPARHEIRVEGVLGEGWSACLTGCGPATAGTDTVISGVIADQPALHGLLNRVRDLGLCLISVHRTG